MNFDVKDSPFRPRLVQHAVSALFAPDRVTLLQLHLLRTVAALVPRHGPGEILSAAAEPAVAGLGGLERGDLVGFA